MNATCSLLLPHTPASVAVARQRLSHDLRSRAAPESAVNDAALVVSELLGNALRHARPLPSGRVLVNWTMSDGQLQIAVSDGGSPTRPRRYGWSLSSVGGRGLEIVEHVASDWGVRHEREATVVWATVSVPHHAGMVPA